MYKYINRELSWLMFNERVLLEARRKELSLRDRFLFLSIFCSNLDEFFMVRVSSLKDQINAKYDGLDISGRSPKEQLDVIVERVNELLKIKNDIYDELIEESKKNGCEIVSFEELSKKKKEELRAEFFGNIYPVLTPMVLDKSRPFPLLLAKSLYIAVKLKDKRNGKNRISLMQVPNNLSRLIELEKDEISAKYLRIEELIIASLDYLYDDLEVETVSLFRITRNADLTLGSDDAEDLLIDIEHSLKKRRWGEVIRIELQSGYDESTINHIKKMLLFETGAVFVEKTLDISFVTKITGPVTSKKFNFRTHIPKKIDYINKNNLFDIVKKKDLFFHLPYDSFSHIEDFLELASRDENVLAIKMTLYRSNAGSRILESLMRAAENGKQVSVLVELMARFDEENNIIWARRLEKTGANVIYGVPGLKTHSKIFLVIRAEEDGIKRYTHLGTGNYNSSTAKLYTDMSILTSREDIGSDASAFFNIISGFGSDSKMGSLIAAPFRIRSYLEMMIENEIKAVNKGLDGEINIKINSLVDKKMIDLLYKASNAGVKIKLLIRGICSLIPGVKGMSENIVVRSIIGQFLEHERIYIFKNSISYKVYLSSADLMTRNLDRRLELLFPITDENISRRVKATYDYLWNDNVQSWQMDSMGVYNRIKEDGDKRHSHEFFKNNIAKYE